MKALFFHSLDEKVTSEYLFNQDYDKLINVVDVNSLRRNLLFTLDLIEMNKPMALHLNIFDVFRKHGYHIDSEKLSEILGINVYETDSNQKLSMYKTLNEDNFKTPSYKVTYGSNIEKYLAKIEDKLHDKDLDIDKRFLAVNLLGENKVALAYIDLDSEILEIIKEAKENIIANKEHLHSLNQCLRCRKRKLVDQIMDEIAYEAVTVDSIKKSMSYRLDKLMYHNFIGIFIFLGVLALTYFIAFNLIGNPISDILDAIFISFGDRLLNIFNNLGLSEVLVSFLIDGLYRGITSVLIFIPQMMLVYFFMNLLINVGYLARVGVLFDYTLSKIGLNGMSILPLVTGIGCSVPAIMAARTITSKKERLITILITPFISCSARIPIYVVFSAAFFDEYAFIAMLSIQLMSASVAIFIGWLLNVTYFKSKSHQFFLEVPPFRKPQIKYLIEITVRKAYDFLKTVMVFVTIGTLITWFLLNFGTSGFGVNPEDSFLALLSSVLAPIFTPLGFGTWQATASVISGLVAKEIVISMMAILYGTSDLVGFLPSQFSVASALSFITFIALYVPCFATLGTIKSETNTKTMLASAGLSLGVAYIAALIVYNVASIFM